MTLIDFNGLCVNIHEAINLLRQALATVLIDDLIYKSVDLLNANIPSQ